MKTPPVKMIEQFQCPGCVCGDNTSCSEYKYSEDDRRCMGHVLGTMISLGNTIALGLPKGFNKPGINWEHKPLRARNTIDVRLWPEGEVFGWDKLNVAVWAMEADGYLFVRTFAPRVNLSWVDVIESGTLAMVPGAIDVLVFLNEID